MMFHPEVWRDFIKPRWAKVIAAALDAKQGGLSLAPTHVLEPEVPPGSCICPKKPE